jgi:hypothetical protein
MAMAQRAEANPSLETRTAARKADFLFANDKRFEAVAGRPLKNVAESAEQGKRDTEETASNTDRALAAEGRTAQPGGNVKTLCAIAVYELICAPNVEGEGQTTAWLNLPKRTNEARRWLSHRPTG